MPLQPEHLMTPLSLTADVTVDFPSCLALNHALQHTATNKLTVLGKFFR